MRWSSSVGLARSSEPATYYLKITISLYGLGWCVVGASVLCWLVDLWRKRPAGFILLRDCVGCFPEHSCQIKDISFEPCTTYTARCSCIYHRYE